MTFKLKYITFLLILLVFSCKSPLELDTPRVEDIDIRNINVLDLSQDTIDFGIIPKNAFEKKLFKIKNTDDKPVEILNIRMKKQPSFFYFDPTQKLTNLILYNNENNNSLNLYLNVNQKNVAEFEDVVLIETADTTFEMVAKSIVPDVKVDDLGIKEQKVGEKKLYRIKISNYSNYIRYIDSFEIENQGDLEITVYLNSKFPKFIFQDDNTEIVVFVTANSPGNYNPRFIFNVKKNSHNEKLILKNECELILNVN